jgi:hypothetical protein
MSTLVFDQATIDKLKAVVAPQAEIRDERGILWGYYQPVVSPETVDQCECPVSEEELARREAEGGGRPLAEILRELENRS